MLQITRHERFVPELTSKWQIMRLERLKLDLASTCWRVYSQAFNKIKTLSPYKQSISEEEFFRFVQDRSFNKYILSARADILGFTPADVVGFALVATNMNAIDDWLEPAFFEAHYPSTLIHFLVGYAIDDTSPLYKRNFNHRLIDFCVDQAVERNGMFCADNTSRAHRHMHKQCHRIANRKNLRVVIDDKLEFIGAMA